MEKGGQGEVIGYERKLRVAEIRIIEQRFVHEELNDVASDSVYPLPDGDAAAANAYNADCCQGVDHDPDKQHEFAAAGRRLLLLFSNGDQGIFGLSCLLVRVV